MSDEDELQPGDRSPVTAHYEELNVFGSPTGTVVQVREVERLPSAPRGFTWRIRREDRWRDALSAARPCPARHSLSCQQEEKADRPQHRENDRAGDIRRIPSPTPAISCTHQGDVQPDHHGFGRESDQ
jgi:hypothetical protein